MTKRKKRILQILGVLLLLTIFTYRGGNEMRPSSHVRAESYVFNVALENKIKELKEKYPQYRFMKTPFGGEPYEYEDRADNKYFYSKEHNLLFCCVLRDRESYYLSILGFYGIFYGTNYRKGYAINSDDLSSEENDRVKKIFETEILPKLGEWKYQRSAFKCFVGLY